MRPADILAAMRENGAGDLEVSFVAMRFIIHAALKIISTAVGDVKEIGFPQWYWVCMPWKVMKQNEVGARLAGHFDGIDKFNVQLQSAISIASYCVSLEQLENVLNATNILASFRIREFWKRKVGIQNTRVKMSELAESFMSDVEEVWRTYKKDYRHYPERVLKNHGITEVALTRFLAFLWNGNGDEWATVYEVNSSTEPFVRLHKSQKVDTIQLTFQRMLQIQSDFMQNIKFYPLKAAAGKDKIDGTDDDVLKDYDASSLGQNIHESYGVELHPSDKIVVLKPFQRVRVVCSVPQFDSDIFEFDFLSLMKYDKVYTLKQLKKAAKEELTLEEVPGSRTYVVQETNQEMYGDDIYRWNAPKLFKDKTGKEQRIASGFKKNPKSNFEIIKITGAELVDDSGEEKKKTPEEELATPGTLETGGVTNNVSVLYTPIVQEPGIYTIRYCLNDLNLDDNETPSSVNKKKLALAPKTYYYNRLINQNSAASEAEQWKNKVLLSSEGFGDMNFKIYAAIALKYLEVENLVARYPLDIPTLKKIFKDKSEKIFEKALKEKDWEMKLVSVNYLTASMMSPTPITAAISASSTAVVAVATPASPPASPARGLSSSKSMFSSPTRALFGNAATTTAEDHKEQEEKEDGIVKMSLNPLAKKKAVPVTGKASSSTSAPTTSAVTTAADPDKMRLISDQIDLYTNSILKMTKDERVRSHLVNLKQNMLTNLLHKPLELFQAEVSLVKLDLAFQVSQLIDKVNAYFNNLLNNWIQSFVNPDGIDKSKLSEADNAVRVVRSLDLFRKSLLPSTLTNIFTETETNLAMVSMNTASEKKLEDSKEQKTSYLFDPENDRTDEANEKLPDLLFCNYYTCKMAVLELDAKESIYQKNIRRLEMLQEKIIDLQETRNKRMLSINAAAMAASSAVAAVPISNSNADSRPKSMAGPKSPSGPDGNAGTAAAAYPGTMKAPTTMTTTTTVAKRASLANYKGLEVEKARELFAALKKVSTRNDAIKFINELITDLNNYISVLLDTANDPKKKASYNTNLEVIKQCMKIIEELENYREQAKLLPQLGYPTTEEEIKLAKHLIVPPFGLIVLVENANALAFGERIEDQNNDYYDDGGEAEKGNESLTQWRPMIEYRYPYNSKNSITIKEQNYTFDLTDYSAKESRKALTYAIFYNAIKKKVDTENSNNKKEETGDGKPSAAANTTEEVPSGKDGEVAGPEKIAPTHFGVFHGEDLLGEPIALEKNSNYKEVDLFEVLCKANDENRLDTSQTVEFTIEFLHPGTEKKEVATEKLKDGPILTIIISDEDDSDDDSDGDGYYDDDDDDNDNGNNDDDDDDYDQDYEEFLMNDLAATAQRIHSYLPEVVFVEGHAEHPLSKLPTVYAGCYECNICGKSGTGWVYHCNEHNYDCHPQCALPYFDDLLEEAMEELEQTNKIRAKTSQMIWNQLPAQVTVEEEQDEHPLMKLASIYGGTYGCDVCKMTGYGVVYHCAECSFEAHPHCVVSNFEEIAASVREERRKRGEPDVEILTEEDEYDNDNEDENEERGEGKEEENTVQDEMEGEAEDE
jgi:hypothetical protein